MNPRKSIHIWCPDIFHSKGGIQAYSAFLLKALIALHPTLPYQVFLKNDPSALPECVSSEKVKFHFFGKLPNWLQTLGFSLQTLTYGVVQRPQLIITTHLHFAPIAYGLKKLTGQPYWAVAHGVESWNIQQPLLKTALQHADLILAVSHYTRDRLLKEQSLDPAKVVILPNTFDADRFQLAPKPAYLLDRYSLKADYPVILTVARLSAAEQYKGYDQIIKALPQVQQTLPNVQYLIVGTGTDLDRIQQLVTHLNLTSCVKFAGFVSDAELADHYHLCEMFAMPSKGEGFGIVYLEALACGKPALGGNQDGAIDALCKGDLGVLVNPDDLEGITKALVQILQGVDSNSRLYQSNYLREQVIRIYGFSSFKHQLSHYLNLVKGN